MDIKEKIRATLRKVVCDLDTLKAMEGFYIPRDVPEVEVVGVRVDEEGYISKLYDGENGEEYDEDVTNDIEPDEQQAWREMWEKEMRRLMKGLMEERDALNLYVENGIKGNQLRRLLYHVRLLFYYKWNMDSLVDEFEEVKLPDEGKEYRSEISHSWYQTCGNLVLHLQKLPVKEMFGKRTRR